jgi:hypothetical protein
MCPVFIFPYLVDIMFLAASTADLMKQPSGIDMLRAGASCKWLKRDRVTEEAFDLPWGSWILPNDFSINWPNRYV